MKKKTLKRKLAGLLAFVLIFGCFPVTAFAEEEEHFVFVPGYVDAGLEIAEPAGEGLVGVTGTAEETANLEYYNSVLEGYVPDVRNQGKYGTCWAFSAMDTAYISMRTGNYITDEEGVYSPLALAYFMCHACPDPLGLEGGDNNTDNTGKGFLDKGGNAYYAALKLAGRVGATSEELVPYSSANPSMSISTSLAYQDEAVLRNAYFLPDENIRLIKEAIAQYGAVSVSFGVGTIEGGYTFLGNNDPDWGHCYYFHDEADGADYSNHAVTIVGWNDNVPADSFATSSEAKRPDGDGAWLIRNSWGAVQTAKNGNNSEEVPYAGYFWLSYEDTSVNSFVALEFVPADTFDRCYQYDGSMGFLSYKRASGKMIGNVYRAQKDEQITAVMNTFLSCDADVDVDIYVSKDKMDDPTDGNLVYSGSYQVGAEGIYTFDITGDVVVSKGEYFSVVYRNAGYGDISFGVEVTTPASQRATSNLLAYNDLHEGECFAGDDTGWTDMYTMNGSTRIKALTTDPVPVLLSFDECDLLLDCGERKEVKIIADESIADDAVYSFVSLDETVATAEMEGDKLTVTATGRGITEIVVTDLTSLNSARLSVRVTDTIMELTFEKSELSLYVGDEEELVINVLPEDAAENFTMESTDKSVAELFVKDGTPYVRAKAEGTTVIVAEAERTKKKATLIVKVSKKSTGDSSSGSSSGGGGSTVKTASSTLTYSSFWFTDGTNWKVHDRAGTLIRNAWLCDNAVSANGVNVWYLLDKDGNMVSAGLIQDGSGNYYSLETEHNGYFGMLRTKNGTYDGIYLEFSQKHDGTFGAVTNAEGIAALKEKYGVKKVTVGNESSVYTGSF